LDKKKGHAPYCFSCRKLFAASEKTCNQCNLPLNDVKTVTLSPGIQLPSHTIIAYTKELLSGSEFYKKYGWDITKW
jgi:predicted amidophosphoribosyltransferase